MGKATIGPNNQCILPLSDQFKEQAKEVLKPEVIEIIKEIIVEKHIPVEVEKIIVVEKEVPVEVLKEIQVFIEKPVEILKESVRIVEREVPVEIIRLHYVDKIKEVVSYEAKVVIVIQILVILGLVSKIIL